MTNLRRREFMKMGALLPQAAILAARPSAWSAARENEVVLNLEPNAANPRNSEGSFVALRSGRILFFYTQFYGGPDDKSPARIAAVHSDDQGRTWSVRH